MNRRPPSNSQAAKRLRGLEAVVTCLEWYNVVHLSFVCVVLVRVIAERLGLASPEVTTGNLVFIGIHTAVLLGGYVWARRRLATERSARS